MWLGVSIFNPLLSVLALSVLPIKAIVQNRCAGMMMMRQA
jgi:hypothetical protein